VGGRLRANWNVSLVAPDASTTEAVDKSGAPTIENGITVIGRADGEQDIWITNNLPYALAVEYGHSAVQAPAGMVRVSIADFQDFLDKAAAEVSRA
jgi:hypothetical protein